jgi:hypothetical protein
VARILDTFPKDDSRTAAHPWDEWMDGRVRELKRGEDFKGSAINFRQNAYKQARQRGKHLRSLVRGDVVVMQALPGVGPGRGRRS